MAKNKSGFTPGLAKGQTPTQGQAYAPSRTQTTEPMTPPGKPANTARPTGANFGASKPPSRVITGADRPAIINTVPRMATNSKDGVVTTPHPEDSQGWYRNRDVREVES